MCVNKILISPVATLKLGFHETFIPAGEMQVQSGNTG